MRQGGTIRGVLCVVLACSTVLGTFVAPACACGVNASLTYASTPLQRERLDTSRVEPCGRPCCSPDRKTSGCCCRNGHSTTPKSSNDSEPAPFRECVGCDYSSEHSSLPPNDSRLSQLKSSELSEPVLSPQFAVRGYNQPASRLSAVEPGYTVDLVVLLSRRTC